MRRTMAALAALAALCSADAEQTPRYAVALAENSGSERLSEDAMRLRITVAADSGQGERFVRIGDVLLCKASDCFRATTSGHVDVTNTATGTASAIAEVVMPIVTITDVYFLEPSGGVAIAGHLKLDTPLAMEKDFYGIELLIGVKKQRTAGKTMYIPSQSGSNYYHPESELVHYLPSTTTVARLSLGTVLTIPSGALDKPQVFNVGVSDRGDLYPGIDIYPYLALNKPVIVEVPAIPGRIANHDMIVPVYPSEYRSPATPMSGSVPARIARLTLSKTASVQPSAFEDSLNPP